jgi:hypothetical protein
VQGEPAWQLDAAIQDMVLRELALQLAHLNSSQGLATFGLPTLTTQPTSAVVADEITKYDATTQAAIQDEHVSQLNPKQQAVYTMSWPLSTAVHFWSMALAALAKPFSTVVC